MKRLLVKEKQFKTISEIFNLDPEVFMVAGPCSIESYDQMDQVAQKLQKNNVKFIRGGAYKPRTSPYDFQGLGLEGLKILDAIRKKYNLITVTEILDPRDLEQSLPYIDIIQIGSRNMFNYSLLKEVGKLDKPVILKRGMMANYNEFLLAAEYIVLNGNHRVVMCERGIKTHCDHVRNILDLAAIALIKHETSLPIIVDLSHSLGRKDILIKISKSVIALGVDGIMVEMHPNPLEAFSDRNQQLNFDEFQSLMTIFNQ